MKRSILLHTLLCIAIAFLIFPCGCNNEPATPEYPPLQKVTVPEPPDTILDESETYSNTEYGFSLKYCNDLQVVENYQGVAVGFLGDMLSGFTQYISIFVAVEELPENMTLRDYLEANKQYAEGVLEDYEILSEEETAVGGIQAIRITYKYSDTVGDMDFIFHNDLTSFIKDNNVYTIKLGVPDRYYYKYKPCYELLLYTFTFD